MQNGWDRQAHQRCFRQGNSTLMFAGLALIALGLLLLFLCIPGWAWAALAGLLFIGVGYVLIRLAKAGR